MGRIAETAELVRSVLQFRPRALATPLLWPNPIIQQPAPTALTYRRFASDYMGNEIVFAAIEMLATSAAEPHIIGQRWRRARPEIRREMRSLMAKGTPHNQLKRLLISNGFIEEVPNHPLVTLLNNPNPFMSRGQLWGNVVADRCLAGNAYLLKARIKEGPFQGVVNELWRLRPDRMRPIPDPQKFIAGYEYNVGIDKVIYPAEDIIHFKTRHPLNDYLGMPPLMAVAGRIDIDNYMRSFLTQFFSLGGIGPGAMLTVGGEMTQEDKQAIRDEYRGRFGNLGGAFELLLLDNTANATYTKLGLDRGLRDVLPKDIDNVNEARIAMAFGIPGSILGLLIGYESSSYANKRQDWQVFWDLTMTPLLSDLDDVLNLSLVPEFAGVDEVSFDLSDIRALQEDVDKIHERTRKDWGSTLMSFEEAREANGLDPNISKGTFLIPTNMMAVSIGYLRGVDAPPPPPPGQIEPAEPALLPEARVVAEVHCPMCGRWVGRNMNAGATAYCPKCKEVPVD